jgi:hypothetical protein
MLKYDFDRRDMIRIDRIKRKIVEYVSLNPGCTVSHVISKMEKEPSPFHASRMTTRKYLAQLQNEEIITETKLGNGLPSELYVNTENPLLILQQALERVETGFRTLSRSLVDAINSNKSERQDVEEEVCDILSGMIDYFSALMKTLIRDYVLIGSHQIANKAVLAKLHDLILSGLANIESAIVTELGKVKGIEDYNRVFDVSTKRFRYEWASDVWIPKEDLTSICDRLGLKDDLDELYWDLCSFPMDRSVRDNFSS